MRVTTGLGPWYGLAVALLWPWSRLFTRRDWRGVRNVPATGGVIIAANHISYSDAFVLTDYLLYGVRRPPRFMAKSELFHGRGFVARVMRGAGQIPVDRDVPNASAALEPAVVALRSGECIAIYPEGTVTHDPGRWPMTGHTGVARLALLSGAPVVPVAQWGAHEIYDSARRPALRLLPRHVVRVQAGPPVDLSGYRGLELTGQLLHEATAVVMAAVTTELESLRGEPRPTTVHP